MPKNKPTSVALTVMSQQGRRPQARKTQKKKKKNSKRKGGKSQQMSTSFTNIHRTVCSVTDPFCIHAKGGRWTDETNIPSLPFQTRGQIACTTNANGHFCAIMVPDWAGGYATSAVEAGGVFTFAGNLTQFDSTFAPHQYRLVTGGWKFISTAAPMTAQGTVIGIEWGGGYGDATALQPWSFKVPARYSQPLAVYSPLSYMHRPAGPTSRVFNQYAAAAVPVNGFSTNDWSWSSLSIQGGPASTTVGYIEWTYNWELTFEENSSYNAFLTKPPGLNPLVNTVSSHVQSERPPFYTGTAEAVSNAVGRLAVKALYSAAPLLKGAAVSGANAYGGPMAGALVGTALGHIPDVD